MSKDSGRTYELPVRFEPHVATVHLGSQKYTTPSRALGELVANALDAGATRVEIAMQENEFGATTLVSVADNGSGITPEVLQSRFALVGCAPPSSSGERLGRFGVGRLAVHRIGGISRWVTVSEGENGQRVESDFVLDTDHPGRVRVTERTVQERVATGTTIEIEDPIDALNGSLAPSRVAGDLLSQYCSYLLAHPDREIIVQGERLNVEWLVDKREIEVIPASGAVPADVHLDHLLLRTAVDRSRFPAQLLFSGKGRTVYSTQPADPPAPQYLGIAESQYLDEVVTTNREGVIEFDPGFQAIQDAVAERVKAFRAKLRSQRSARFIEAARQEEYYPFRSTPADPIAQVERVFFDVALEQVNEHANIASMTKTQQAVVFRLLRRAVENENLLDILQEVAQLSDRDIERFRTVLERTTLDSIIKLSSEVTDRLHFLDVLHELVYGDLSAHLKERTQLHRIIEPHGWIFGPQYHLATSDRGFREVIRRHRALAGLEAAEVTDLNDIDGINKIPDLFLASQREYPTEPKHHHLVVEIKAPKVDVGSKERDQIRRYAEIIQNSAEFDKRSVHWDLYVVSADIKNEIEWDRNQSNRPRGVLYDWQNMTVRALKWSEIITAAREELRMVRDHLQSKSRELSVSEYLRTNFPEILASLEMKLAS